MSAKILVTFETPAEILQFERAFHAMTERALQIFAEEIGARPYCRHTCATDELEKGMAELLVDSTRAIAKLPDDEELTKKLAEIIHAHFPSQRKSGTSMGEVAYAVSKNPRTTLNLKIVTTHVPAAKDDSPAFKAIVEVTKDVIEAYQDDVLVHDADLIRRFPDRQFLYFFRNSGSHLIPLMPSDAPSSRSETSTILTLMDANSHHFFWTGQELLPVSKEWILQKLLMSRPIVVQL